MKSQIIIDKLLKPEHFLIATSEEGPYIKQPVPYTSNEGFMRLISCGDLDGEISSFSYNGEATAVGGGTTLQDSLLVAFGDDFFIGGTITWTAGSNASGSTAITDFHGATGCLVWGSSVTATASGDSYTLTLDYRNRDFRALLIDSGDPGQATFKWSHNGGENYFGRDNPNQATWINSGYIASAASGSSIAGPAIAQAQDGSWVVCYPNKTSTIKCIKSTDNGMTWSSAVDIGTEADSDYVWKLISLSSGRLMLISTVWGASGYTKFFYSDDYGDTWSEFITDGAMNEYSRGTICETTDGRIIHAYAPGQWLYVRVSTDGGRTFGSPTLVRKNLNAINAPSIIQAANGDLLCFVKDYHSTTQPACITVYKSTDGSNWDVSPTVVAEMGTADLLSPSAIVDANGDIYVSFSEDVTSTFHIYFSVSTDDGDTWGASKQLYAAESGVSAKFSHLALMDGHEIVCGFLAYGHGVYDSGSSIGLLRRGVWTNYDDVSACPCAINTMQQNLVCDVGVKWYGGEGIANDKWTITPSHWYAASNVVEDSPRKYWRSQEDDVTCELVIDMESAGRLFANGISLFNCNFSSCSVELNTSADFSSPSVSHKVNFVLESGTVDSLTGSFLEDASIAAKYREHELGAGQHYITMTSGSDVSETWKLQDNVEDYLVLDTTALTDVTTSDTFDMYQNHSSLMFSGGAYRYLRIYIPAQRTHEGYYQIGNMIVGSGVTLNNTWADRNYTVENDYQVEFLRTMSGSMTPLNHGDRKKTFNLSWDRSETSRREVESIVRYAKGANMALIPDSNSATEVYLVKQVGRIQENFRYRNRWDLSVTFEENV